MRATVIAIEWLCITAREGWMRDNGVLTAHEEHILNEQLPGNRRSNDTPLRLSALPIFSN